jgi:hypothetical protein
MIARASATAGPFWLKALATVEARLSVSREYLAYTRYSFRFGNEAITFAGRGEDYKNNALGNLLRFCACRKITDFAQRTKVSSRHLGVW